MATQLDLVIAVALAVLAAVIAHRLSADIPLQAYQSTSNSDRWFDGDLGRVMLAMADPGEPAATDRSSVHPLFILLVNPPVAVLRWLGWEHLHAARVGVAGMAGLWLATLYGVLRLVGLRWPDAILFALVGGTSAAAAFWLTVPETYALGSFTILVPLGLVALSRYRSVPEWASVVASAGSLSITTTNWMAGWAAAAVSYPWRRAFLVTAKALAVVMLVWGVQKLVYPGVDFFIGEGVERSRKQLFSPLAGGPGHVLKASFVFSEAMPSVDTMQVRVSQLSVRLHRGGRGSRVGSVAVGGGLGAGRCSGCSPVPHRAGGHAGGPGGGRAPIWQRDIPVRAQLHRPLGRGRGFSGDHPCATDVPGHRRGGRSLWRDQQLRPPGRSRRAATPAVGPIGDRPVPGEQSRQHAGRRSFDAAEHHRRVG
jgi:hypothetical protein